MQRLHPWERTWRSGFWKEGPPPSPAVAKFTTLLKKSKAVRVLDLGSGPGRHTVFLAEIGFQVTALDVSETALRILDRHVRKNGFSNVTIVKHDLQKLPFLDEYFDAIVSTDVIHHGLGSEIKVALGEIRRVLRKKGYCILIVLSDKDLRLGSGRQLEPGTWRFTQGEEKGITHHFFREEELRSYLKDFEIKSLKEDLFAVEKGYRAHFQAVLRKP